MKWAPWIVLLGGALLAYLGFLHDGLPGFVKLYLAFSGLTFMFVSVVMWFLIRKDYL